MRVLVVVLGLVVLAGGACFALLRPVSPQGDPTPPSGTANPGTPHSGTPVDVTPSGAPSTAPSEASTDAGAKPNAGLSQRGTVRDASGSPVAGIPVVVAGNHTGLGGPLVDGGRFLSRSVTDTAGRFEVQAPRAESLWVGPVSSRELPPFLGMPVQLDFTKPRADLDLVVRRATTLSGRVAVAGSNALPPRETRIAGIGERTGHSVHTSVDPLTGRFELAPIGDETYFLVAATHDLVSGGAHGVAPGSTDTVLTLGAVGKLDVVVTGGPAEGVRTEVVRVDGHVTDRARMLLSGRSPQFLRPGAYVVSAFTNDLFGHARAEDLGPPGAPRRLEIALGPAAMLAITNEGDLPAIIIVEQGGVAVRAMSVIAKSAFPITIPAGPVTAHEFRFDGTPGVTRTLDLAPGARAELRLGAP